MTFKRDYLTKNEQYQMMFLISLKNNVADMINDWEKRNVTSKKAMDFLKSANQNLLNACAEIFKCIDPKQIATLDRKMKVNTVRLYDNYMLEQINEKNSKVFDCIKLTADEFFDMCEWLMTACCQDCNSSWNKCPLYEIFKQYNISEPTGYGRLKCPYAYTSDELNEKIEEDKKAGVD